MKEELRIHEEQRIRQPQHREEVHIHKEEQYHQPQQRDEVHIHEQTRYRQPEQRKDRVEFEVSRDRYQPPTSHHNHVEVQERAYGRHFDTVHGPATDSAPSQIDVTERQFRERTRPIVAQSGYTNLTTHANDQQASRYTRDTFTAKQDSQPYRRQADSVDGRYPSEVRVEETTRATVDTPKKYKRDMGYYDHDGQYHSLRHGISKAAHKVAERVAHPIHPHRHHHSSEHSNVASKYDDSREEVIVKDQYTTTVPSVAPSRPVNSGSPVERVVRVSSSSSQAAPPVHAQSTYSSHSASAPQQALVPHPTYTSHSAPVPQQARAPQPTYASHSAPAIPSAPATARKMASPNTITIPCHHIRIGDLLILQGRPCQVIRITTSSQTGQHRYLGVDLFTKQLHEESSFISNPAPSVVVQNMLGPVFKQYRVLDIREDGRVVAMTESGDVKQGLPVLDQSALLSRLTESFDNGRGSVRILVINDDGMEMAVDYKVVHGSRL